MTFLVDLLAATLRNATPLVYGTVGETVRRARGVLNLGIEGTMYAGAFAGFAVACATGDPAARPGRRPSSWASLAGAVMALLTVTLGANQHVSGLGLTIVAHRPVASSPTGSSSRAASSSASSRCRSGTRWPAWARSAPSRTSTA